MTLDPDRVQKILNTAMAMPVLTCDACAEIRQDRQSCDFVVSLCTCNFERPVNKILLFLQKLELDISLPSFK